MCDKGRSYGRVFSRGVWQIKDLGKSGIDSKGLTVGVSDLLPEVSDFPGSAASQGLRG